MARQLAWRKLFKGMAEGLGSSVLDGASTPFRSAAWKTAFMSTATPPKPDSSGHACTFSFWAVKAPVSCSSSSSGKSLDSLKSLMSLVGSLPLINSVAFAPAKKYRLGMSMVRAATMVSKRISLSMLMKVASHFEQPHSMRLSLSNGVRISNGLISSWYFRYSTTLASAGFLKGNSMATSGPVCAACSMVLLAMQRASASTSKASPSSDLSVNVSPLRFTGQEPQPNHAVLPRTSINSPAMLTRRGGPNCWGRRAEERASACS
mmetsp:Transcript_71269/g.208916  ORF Transcript_71269/g.208916 Transcript_71269/m.208916 type:complete len:263 (-) Transcript_71269:13-801(-)